mmetsp:Transcript_58230/g.95624  ORF Transcript_58230/g.95624 Transcript_58230/m.95624 type:complete len:83 (+) Transcript_58230:133-381(+)
MYSTLNTGSQVGATCVDAIGHAWPSVFCTTLKSHSPDEKPTGTHIQNTGQTLSTTKRLSLSRTVGSTLWLTIYCNTHFIGIN